MATVIAKTKPGKRPGTPARLHERLNQSTRHWYTGSTRRRAISVFQGHRVYESCVERFSVQVGFLCQCQALRVLRSIDSANLPAWEITAAWPGNAGLWGRGGEGSDTPVGRGVPLSGPKTQQRLYPIWVVQWCFCDTYMQYILYWQKILNNLFSLFRWEKPLKDCFSYSFCFQLAQQFVAQEPKQT